MGLPMLKDPDPKAVRISERVSKGEEHAAKLVNLTSAEAAQIDSTLSGNSWIRAVDGRLESRPVWEPLPRPAEDPLIAPFWSPSQVPPPATLELLPATDFKSLTPSFVVQHLCGYNYTPLGYREEAERLEAFGFTCLRSQRGEDGRFDEMWYLPGAWAAKGDLKLHLEGVPREQHMDTVVAFLCRRASFGTLDIMQQRAAMTID